MPTVAWNGADLSVDVIGRGSTTVLFIHGLGASKRCFAEASAHLDPDRYTLVLPDLPGFGESAAPAGLDLSMDALADAVNAVVTTLGVTGIHLVGHSMGGVVALLAASAPEVEVRSFVSAEGNLVPDDAVMSSKVSRLSERTFERVWTKWLAMVAESLDPAKARQHEIFLEDLGASSPHVIHSVSKSCWALTSSGRLGELFTALACPRLYIVGEQTLAERPLPPPVVESKTPVVTIASAGHFVMENASAFYRAVRSFIDGVS